MRKPTTPAPAKPATVTAPVAPQQALSGNAAAILAVPSAAPATAPVKAAKYAPLTVVTPNAVITMVQSTNPKKPTSAAGARWAKFMRTGITVAQLGAQYKAANLPANWATLDVRWALQRGHIAIGTPVPAAAVDQPTNS